MSTPWRLTLYLASLVAVFGVMYLAGRTLVPEETVSNWTEQAKESDAGHDETDRGPAGPERDEDMTMEAR